MSQEHAFLCYRERDKDAALRLSEALAKRGLQSWIEALDAMPGRLRQEEVENAISTACAAVVLIGAEGLGSWQNPTMRVCLEEAVQHKKPVIPVLLPGSPKAPQLPAFLRAYMGVELREQIDDERALDRLALGITGQRLDRAPALGDAAEIPPLLPFLPDRRVQEEQLVDFFGNLPRDFSHPLLCVVHGGRQQSHDTFLDKLKKHILPRLLGLDPTRQPVEDWELHWPATLRDNHQLHQRLCQSLAREVLGRDHATTEETQARFAGIPGPVLIHTNLMTQDWENHGPDILGGFADFWQTWPDLAPGQRLLVFLFIKYQDDFEGGYLKKWRFRKLNGRIRRNLVSLDLTCRDRLSGAVLSELTSVRQPDVEIWARSREARRFRHSHELIREIGRIFQRQDEFPMDRLADELRIILRSRGAWT